MANRAGGMNAGNPRKYAGTGAGAGVHDPGFHTKAKTSRFPPEAYDRALMAGGDPEGPMDVGPASVIDDALSRMQEHLMVLNKTLDEVMGLAAGRLHSVLPPDSCKNASGAEDGPINERQCSLVTQRIHDMTGLILAARMRVEDIAGVIQRVEC